MSDDLEMQIKDAHAKGKAEGLREAADHAVAVIKAKSEYDQHMCCNGDVCGCQGITVHEDMTYFILALIPADTPAAADRIEELEAKLEALDHAYDSIVQALRFEALRTDDAEAKLAKAVEAFTDLEQDCEADYPPSHGAMKYYIQRALAELKGEQP